MLKQPSKVVHRSRQMALTCLTIFALVTTAACGAGEKQTAGTAGSKGSNSSDATAAVNKSAANLAKFSKEITKFPDIKPLVGGISSLKGKNVWFVTFGSGVPVLNALGVTTGKALEKAGLSFHQCDGKFVPTTIAACLTQAADQGADAVITAYIDYALVPTSFDALVAKNIPVLLAGVQPTGGKASSAKFVFLPGIKQNLQNQKLAADAIIVDSKGKANILYVGSTDAEPTKLMASTAKDYVASACPGCTFTDIQYTTASLDKLSSQVSSALVAHPDTTYVMPTFDNTVPQVIAGIQSANFGDKVKIASTTGSTDSLQRIKDGGPMFADVGSGPTYTGWLYADGILRELMGSAPDQDNLGVSRVFTKVNVGKLNLSPDAYLTNAWYGSNEYQQTFLSAWNGK